MCGIWGTFHFDPSYQPSINTCQNSLRLLAHRGPDDSGLLIDGSVAMGFRRLSIVDLSENGRQPFVSTDHSTAIMVNGEFYNYSEIKRKLEADGAQFRSNSDSEALLHLYPRYLTESIQMLEGMFSVAIWDQKREMLTLARDHSGQKPLYYFVDNDKIEFSSEIKAIISNPNVPREIDPTAIDYYLSLQYIPHPYTGFKNIYKLPPGHILQVDRSGSLNLFSYWNSKTTTRSSRPVVNISSKTYAEGEELLSQAVNSHFQADTDVGIFLSGGLDSSTIALLSTFNRYQPKAFSVKYTEKGFDESGIARSVASKLGLEFYKVLVSSTILQDAQDIVWYTGIPCGDPSFLPFYALSKETKEDLKVVLSGDGGDELFGGYNRYTGLVGQKRSENYTQEAHKLLELSQYLSEEQKGILYHADFKEILHKNQSSTLNFMQVFLEESQPSTMLEAAVAWDFKYYLSDDLLLKTDTMTMANGLELRSPFLDRKVMEWAMSFSLDNQHVSSIGTKQILKKILSPHLSKRLIHRPKWGLRGPIEGWISNGETSFLFEQFFTNSALVGHGIFNQKSLSQLLNGEKRQNQISGLSIWTILMLEIWLKTCIDAPPETFAPLPIRKTLDANLVGGIHA